MRTFTPEGRDVSVTGELLGEYLHDTAIETGNDPNEELARSVNERGWQTISTSRKRVVGHAHRAEPLVLGGSTTKAADSTQAHGPVGDRVGLGWEFGVGDLAEPARNGTVIGVASTSNSPRSNSTPMACNGAIPNISCARGCVSTRNPANGGATVVTRSARSGTPDSCSK